MSTATTSKEEKMSRHPRTTIRNASEAEQARWSEFVEQQYGIRIGGGEFYFDGRGYVMAGSEYVARLHPTSTRPEDATEWAEAIGSMDRVTKQAVVSRRLPAHERSELMWRARQDYERSRTPAVLAGLKMVRNSGGSMAAIPAADGLGPQPCKIANLVAWAHTSGSHKVQAEFDAYGYYSDRLAKISTGQPVGTVCQCNKLWNVPHDMGSTGCAYAE